MRFVLTAGHCAPNVQGPTGTVLNPILHHNGKQVANLFYSGSTPAAIWDDPLGRDGALYNIDPSAASGTFVHQTAPAGGAAQGTPYIDYWNQWNQIQPYEERMVCFEGASSFRYEQKPPANVTWPNAADFNGKTACGLTYGGSVWANQYQLVNLYPDQVVCGGDSGALVRYPNSLSNGIGSTIIGVVHGRNPVPAVRDGSGPDVSCSWFGKSTTPYPNAIMYYSSYQNLVNYFNATFAMNLVPVYNDVNLKLQAPGSGGLDCAVRPFGSSGIVARQTCANLGANWTAVAMNLGNTDQYLLWDGGGLCAEANANGTAVVAVGCTWALNQLWNFDAQPNQGNQFVIRNNATSLVWQRAAGVVVGPNTFNASQIWTPAP